MLSCGEYNDMLAFISNAQKGSGKED